MKNPSNPILVFLLSVQLVSFSQQKMDIGLLYGADAKSLGIEFRRDIKENYKLRVGIGYEERANYFTNSRELIFTSSQLRVWRNYRYVEKIKSIRFGFERKIKKGFGFFSIPIDLVIAHNRRSEKNHNHAEKRNQLGEWNFYENEFDMKTHYNGTYILENYLKTSLRSGVSMDVPLFKSFYINVYYLVNFGTTFLLNESVENNLYGEFVPASQSFVNFNLSADYGIGLRYVFGGRK